MKVHERIRELREDRDLSQTQIACLLKTSQTVYSRYELNKRNLPIDFLYELCKFYNVSADYILGFTDEYVPLPKKSRR
jgi:transcriptional regulator with XRE-family HTH domain